MAEQGTEETTVVDTEPHGEEPDYKALYEEAKARSRKWEKQSKANLAEMQKAQQAGKTAEEQIADLRKRLDEKERAEERAKLAASVASKKGIPVELVVGDDEEAMEAFADRMLAHFQKKPAPKVEKPGSFDRGDGDVSELREFTRQLMDKD